MALWVWVAVGMALILTVAAAMDARNRRLGIEVDPAEVRARRRAHGRQLRRSLLPRAVRAGRRDHASGESPRTDHTGRER